MTRFFFETAMRPGGWATNVAVRVEEGVIVEVLDGVTRLAGDITGDIALPGLASLHSHTFQRGMAGLAETRGPSQDSFWSWRQVMYRYLAALGPGDIEAIAAFAFMEMLEGGFTAAGEFHYLHHAPDGARYDDIAETSARIAAAAIGAGIGLTHLPVFYAQGGFGGLPPTEGQRRFVNDLESFERLHAAAARAVETVPDVAVGVAPHSLRAVTPGDLSALAGHHRTGPIHIHIAEQVREVEDCLAWSGRRPVEWLFDHATVDARWCLVHATHMTPHEGRLAARSGAVAGLCPITEANLGDGIFDAPVLLENGGRFGVGTDSNVEITAPGELRQLEYSQRLALRARNVFAREAGASTGAALYRGALAGGARAMGRRIGAIETGFRADFVVLDAALPDFEGVRGDAVLDQLIFVTGAKAISAVYVGGEMRVKDGRHMAREAISRRYAEALGRLKEI